MARRPRQPSVLSNFDDARAQFPIRHQSGNNNSANEAARLLIAVPVTDPDYVRAQAWFAYLCATAVLDWWEWTAAAWDPWAGLPRAQLWSLALTLADEAVENAPNKKARYDALWARGYIAINDGRPDDALDDYILATHYGGQNKDANVLAEAADAAVYAGDITQARTWIDTAFATLEDPTDPPKWFYWVRGWVAVAEGAQFALGSAQGIAKGTAAETDLNLMNFNHLPNDFDAAVTMLLARKLKTPTGFDQTLWDRFKERAKDRKKVVWCRQLELARSPFQTSVQAARNVRDLIAATIPDPP